ncbi:MAG TPA: 2-amino-4-hydroxy-6-hydroxymethyldihydropteridine diphosphokinase [Candidatus Nanoarchaeia archaeon]|nr:2-amino-4-hydroxy-6-hydroxymethyldihydropteridine diphosphokinase [Candidatus Nanoarchaeia archaeon]
MPQAFIGVGSNLGDKEQNIKKAVSEIKKISKTIKLSSLYKTEPVGFKEQDWFLNCALEIETKLAPADLLKSLKEIEKKMGREKTFKNGPRIIDLDMLFYGNTVLKNKTLKIPHPKIRERKFVLVPLNEIAPDFIHPKLKKKVNDLLKETKDKSEVELYA